MVSSPQIPDLVSTIIPVYNRAALLREAVASVLAQSYRPIEIIIVDDGSTDDTPEAIATLATEHTCVRSVRIESGGPGVAREAGRQFARGEFIQYLDSDDLLMPTKFDTQVSALRRQPECDVAYGKTRQCQIGEIASDVAWKRTGEQISTMFPSFLQSRWWDTSTPLYRRSLVDLIGPWLSLRNEEDWEYDCRVARQGVRLAYCNQFVSETRIHSGVMLSANGLSREGLIDRAKAHEFIFAHAMAAGISRAATEMKHFSRELFLIARQCAAVGLTAEAARLFQLARQSSNNDLLRVGQFIAFQIATDIMGWKAVGRFSQQLDRLRS